MLFSLLSRNRMLSRPLSWTERHLKSGKYARNMLEVNECEYEPERYIVGGGHLMPSTAISSDYQLLLGSSPFFFFFFFFVFNFVVKAHCFFFSDD